MEKGDTTMDEQFVQNAMQIIMFAGDARVCCKDSLDAVVAQDFETARAKLKEAQGMIAEAHHIQTDAIQKEVGGEEKLEYSMLFTHAQDTLMTIYSEINMTKHIINISESLEKRISALEKGI